MEKKPLAKFRKNGNQLKTPFVIYADFESLVLNQEDLKEKSDQTFTHEFQNQEACGFGYKLVCTDPQFTRDFYLSRT